MKRNLIRTFVFLLVLVLCLPAAQASTVKLAPIGSIEEIIPVAAVYCNKWHELIGSTLGYDMAFNESNIKRTEDKHYDIGGNQVTTFNMDGIHVDVDDDLNIYTIMIPIKEGRKEQYTSTARIFAVLNAVAYDYPHSEAEMTQRYMACLGEYLDFMEKNKEIIAAGQLAYWEIETDKGEFEFQFYAVNGRQYMMFDKMYFDVEK